MLQNPLTAEAPVFGGVEPWAVSIPPWPRGLIHSQESIWTRVMKGIFLTALLLVSVLRSSPAYASVTGIHRAALIIVSYSNQANSNTVADVTSVGANLKAFYTELSYGLLAVVFDVLDPVTIALASGGCDTATIQSEADAALVAQGVNLSVYQHKVYSFPPSPSCPFWGTSTVDGNPSSTWIQNPLFEGVWAHELGHGLGFWHSQSLDCGTIAWSTTCTAFDHGDYFDVMGAATQSHTNAIQKQLAGWAVAQPITASGTYTLLPWETNPSSLRFDRAGGTLFFEYRQPIGADTVLQQFGVLVHVQQPVGAANGVYLLDMTPETTSWVDPVLTVGRPWTDPVSGVAFTVQSAGPRGAVILVSMPVPSNVKITFPLREHAATPTLATLKWSRPECASQSLIPYIQTSQTLTVTADATVPSGGGVRFTMTPGTGSPVAWLAMSAPYEATFTGLTKGTYTLDAQVVDAAFINVGASDQATGIAVGDVYVLIGDSTTVGQGGLAYVHAPYLTWDAAPDRSNDNRDYAHCGLTISNGSIVSNGIQYQGMGLEMNDLLAPRPVYLWNAGVGSSTTTTWLSRVTAANFALPMGQLKPNKAIIDLGSSEFGGSDTWQAHIESIADTLVTTSGITYSGIYLAVPGARTNWHPYWEQAIANKGLMPGPDFNVWFAAHPSQLVDGIHPNVAGYTSKATLTVNAIYSPVIPTPTNLQVH